ncbi:hypothetical protein [Prauserella endophytica]|uniref:Uncharacterized protein n=1 Tax=Prauserella endophytica TaxID=1592324 RepID=A0ABY2S3F1_9PSEU|nr:hypothetical protein [Prauserella endophytica]PXY34236.1 hypothetical protein BAY59_01390 [Prauserella coralliicola]TKG70074.1 hypothetical protein FCN18_18445 [Prauserella endophytica]
MPLRGDELATPVVWRVTGHGCFPHAASVDGRWWVLRVNHWPDHPLYSLLIDAVWRGDLSFDDGDGWWPRAWQEATRGGLPELSRAELNAALGPVQGFTAYGSESGRSCDCFFCL